MLDDIVLLLSPKGDVTAIETARPLAYAENISAYRIMTFSGKTILNEIAGRQDLHAYVVQRGEEIT